jgi:hypothetical protein
VPAWNKLAAENVVVYIRYEVLHCRISTTAWEKIRQPIVGNGGAVRVTGSGRLQPAILIELPSVERPVDSDIGRSNLMLSAS